MAWTQSDIDALESAIKALAAGAKRVQYAERMVEYHDLDSLIRLRETMSAAVGTSSDRFSVGIFTKL